MRNLITMALAVLFGMILIAACSGTGGTGEKQEATAAAEPHDERGVELTLDETYDQVRNGARLILAYDADTNFFKGTIENTTQETLYHVRVEVHLSNGNELGPVEPGDLAPGEKRDVELKATSTDFDGWSAHPEVVRGEHEHD